MYPKEKMSFENIITVRIEILKQPVRQRIVARPVECSVSTVN